MLPATEIYDSRPADVSRTRERLYFTQHATLQGVGKSPSVRNPCGILKFYIGIRYGDYPARVIHGHCTDEIAFSNLEAMRMRAGHSRQLLRLPNR